jgi:amidase
VSELWRKGAVELAALIRDREVSSREVIQAHLDRIEAVNPALNAIVRLLPDEALAAADAADRAVADGTTLGPLHGVPFTVKENIDLAGTPTTHAIPALAEAVAPIDAPQVERLRAAGAIPVGRTNLPDFGLRVHTDSWLHGLTRNPWSPERTPGGSSGGEAAALATGMSPFGLGNDLGGSLRNPAHCCGVASIKPSTGAVPAATVIPPEDYNISFQLMAVEGVLARRVADVRAAFTVIDNAIATLELMRPVLPANLLGTPAAVVPAGMADGLPVGVQVMGGKYTELRCLAVAEAIEQRIGPLTPIDPVAG